MDGPALILQRHRQWLMALTATLAQAFWVWLPFARRPQSVGVYEWAAMGVVPVFFIWGVRNRRYGPLVIGIPLAWLLALPLAPRDGLGNEEILTMAVTGMLYLTSVIYWAAQPSSSDTVRPVQWAHLCTADAESHHDWRHLRVWVIPVGVTISALTVLSWTDLNLALNRYNPRAASRMYVAMVFFVAVMGLIFHLRLEQAHIRWIHRKTTPVLGLMATGVTILFVLWRVL